MHPGNRTPCFTAFFRKIRRSARHWNTDTTRSDRNAVIQRVVAAAAKESLDNLNGDGEGRRTPRAAEPLAAGGATARAGRGRRGRTARR